MLHVFPRNPKFGYFFGRMGENQNHLLSTEKMRHLYFTKLFFFFSFFLLALNYQTIAQIQSARISENSSNRLIVNLGSRTNLSNANGWYLVGGGAEIKSLVSGSGSSTLTFQLTDFILPNDNFKLYYYRELGNAVSNGIKINSVANLSVSKSGINSYKGTGTVFYVSRSGSSSNSGLSRSATTTFESAITKASAGDYVLFKKGETWSKNFQIQDKRGTADRYITVGTYGSGSMPIITGSARDMWEIRRSHYVQIVGFETRPNKGSGGARITGDSRYAKLRSLKVVGRSSYGDGTGLGWGISYSTKDGRGNTPLHSIVMHCDVSRFRDGIYGLQIRGGGQVRFNKVSYCSVDGIRAFNGNTGGIIVGHNEITKFSDDGIDLFKGSGVIVEYNKIYDPVRPQSNGANNGIKAGGYNSTGISRNNIIRYNTIYNLLIKDGSSPHAITTNSGFSGEIYGNLCYNIDHSAIEVASRTTSGTWKVYNNTAISNKQNGIYISAYNPNVILDNNIFKGPFTDIRVAAASSKATGRNNILIHNKTFGNYRGNRDRNATLTEVFVNPSRGNFLPKDGGPAVNNGISISSYNSDNIGSRISNTIDIGSLERKSGNSIPTNPEPEPEPEPEPDPTPEEPADFVNGLDYSYYEGNWSSLPNFSQLSKIKEGTIFNFNLVPRNRDDNFALTYEGYIQIDRTGTQTFFVESDEGSKLYINGKLVVDNDGLHTIRERSGSISLSAGKHAIRVEYFERSGNQHIKVRYAGPSLSKRAIPHEKLFRKNNNARVVNATKTKGSALTDSLNEVESVDIPLQASFKVFPNPVQSDINIQLGELVSGSDLRLQIVDMVGRVVHEHQYSIVDIGGVLSYPLNELPRGNYVLILSDNNNKLIEEKIIKK